MLHFSTKTSDVLVFASGNATGDETDVYEVSVKQRVEPSSIIGRLMYCGSTYM